MVRKPRRIRGKEGTVPKIVPYEIFLLRRLQQAQRRAGDAAADGWSGGGDVLLFVRPANASRHDDGFAGSIAEAP